MIKKLLIFVLALFVIAACSSGKNVKSSSGKNVKKPKTFIGNLNGKNVIRVVGYSSPLESPKGELLKKPEERFIMTTDQSGMDASMKLSMLIDQTIKEYFVKITDKNGTSSTSVKEVISKSKISGSKVIDTYQDERYGIYTLLELELTPEQLKKQKIDNVKLFMEIAKKRAKNLNSF